MTTKVYIKSTNKRYLDNNNPSKMEVHDLYATTNDCQINETLAVGHAVLFNLDSLEQAHLEGYDNCAYCLGYSKR